MAAWLRIDDALNVDSVRGCCYGDPFRDRIRLER